MGRPRLPLPLEELSKQHNAIFIVLLGTSPMASVLAGVAAMEQALGTLLSKFLITGNTSEGILHPNKGFLGPLMNRASLAYCMGLISKTTYQNIQRLAEIRNLFAHSHTAIDFQDAEVAEQCRQLKLGLDKATDHALMTPEVAQALKTDMRQRFTHAVMTIFGQLLRTVEQTERASPKGWATNE